MVEALAYSDVYAWPLTAHEVHRFLPVPAPRAEVMASLASARLSRVVAAVDGCWVLRGREHVVAERRRREAASQRLWPAVERSARTLARIPWVRMVAVSGSLALNAAQPGDDVDLLIVTDEGRLWMSRALAITAGRLSRLTLCPNYMVTESALEFADRDIYTAHELAQLEPLFGARTYAELLERNRWYRELLPNHAGFGGVIPERRERRCSPRSLERLLARVERWEMERKVSRLRAAGAGSAETCFDATVCKGHVGGHRARFWREFEARLEALAA